EQLVVLATAASLRGLQQQPASQTLVAVIGSDTQTVERFSLVASTLTGDVWFLRERAHTRYLIELGPDGRMNRAEVTNDGGVSIARILLTVSSDSLRVTLRRADSDRDSSYVVAVTGPVYPWMGASFGLIEHAVGATRPAI